MAGRSCSTVVRWRHHRSLTTTPQEKVEEDRFMREQEKAFFEKKKAEMDEKMHAEELKEYEAVIAPAMAEAHSVLKAEGAEVDVPALEALARWKLGK